ncbi:glycosyl hydrolase [Acrocarpospora corrugata]|uniref:Glycosyl hydrolase n=1 Tax=Acrocarpospora corrugata TaxID=35763 RepID=A0A5M3VRE7_9ACTN|nr:discoidin domain-containing protein [Acrocarpospora corrugata]GER99354.1 glycosyl hydrolase [Acrocarpospora corrugata]
MRKTHGPLRMVAAALAAGLLVLAGSVVPAAAAGGPNLSLGKTAAASSSTAGHAAGSINDGNQATYWESTNNSFPQWAQVDLGSATSIDQVILKLPNDPAWQTRTITLSVQGSNDGTSYATIVGSAGYTFNPATSNTVTINFPAVSTRYLRINITANNGWPAGQLSELEVYGTSTGGSANLAQGKTMTGSSVSQNYVASNANDLNQATYWESNNNVFPEWLQVDLGASLPVNRVVLKLPASGWATRTQTLAVQGSQNGSTFTDIVASAGYVFNPANGNTVTINFSGTTTTRYVRLNITANTGWAAGQISEFEVYGPTTGDTQPPTAPANLAFTEQTAGQVRLTWTAATDNVGVTGYDIYANNTLRASVGNVTTYTDTQPVSATVTYFVRAKDAASLVSGNSNTVTRQGQSGDTQNPTVPGNLTYTEPGSGQIRLAWTASTDNVGVTGYDVYRNGTVAASVAGNVLTYTDTQPATATVTYYVRAKDAAGNQSGESNSVTRPGSNPPGTNLATGKEMVESGHVHTFVAANANDGSLDTYWEGASGTWPSVLTVKLGANASVTSVVLKLNPSSAWGSRTQNIQVLGRDQAATGYTNLVSAANYTFNPAAQNTVTIPVTATTADVQIRINSNTGAPGGQIAEFQVFGTPAPNPDLVVTSATWSPASPVETDAITLSAVVRNSGTANAPASSVNLYLDTTRVATVNVPALAAGAQTTVTANIGPRDAAAYSVNAKVDEANTIIEQNDGNNAYVNPAALTVRPVDSSDLVASPVAWTPSNPSGGQTVTFSVGIRNQGTVASAGGAHGITLTVLNDQGTVVRTLTGTHTGVINAGATAAPIGLGTWTAANGRFTVRVVLANDANELPVKQANNTTNTSLFVGRGANMPYDHLEAEDAVRGGGAGIVGPNRTIGDLGGEASGRRAVTLNTNGAFVEFTTRAPTNTLVTRFSIPDSAGGGGINSSLNVYVNGTFHKAINLTSKYVWQYGNEASPNNSPGSGGPRHIYDEANVFLNSSFPVGTKIRLQKDPGNDTTYAIDFIDTEQVAPIANPDPAKYVVPTGFTQQAVTAALDKARMETGWEGVYLPAGDYQVSSKVTVYGKAIKVVGAGPWYTRFYAPTGQENTDIGFDMQSSANGTTFSGFAVFGNYTQRNDGPGKVWNLTGVSNITIDNMWIEHQMVMVWGTNVSNLTLTNSRVRNMYADGLNLTNNSRNNTVRNIDARSTGDDAFALFNAVDIVQGDNTGNLWENLSVTTPWRAAGLAVYGGFDNTFRNIYIADTLTYSGITVSSLDFGYQFRGFGTTPTVLENISIIRSGGHFWGAQTFPAIWLFSASKEFRGIRISNVDIVDPTYSGIMFQTKYTGSTPENPVTDTILTNITITGAQKSGDAFDAKSGFGIWANELPEPGQGPAVGSATFNNLVLSNNFQNIKNTTSTFTINTN